MPGLPKTAWLALAALGCGVAFGLLGRGDEPSDIVFLSVGQGDCTAIRHAGATILVDVGPSTDGFDAGSRIVAPKLRNLGVSRVDLVLLTHPDRDHIGGLAGLARRISIGRVGVSSEFRKHPDLLAALDAARIDPDLVWWIDGDRRVSYGGMSLFIRAPKRIEGESDNEGSLFLVARLPGLTAVLSGDAGKETEIEQAGRGDWRADVLKAGHHGSGGSTSEAWLKEVRPRWVVVSCGLANRFGHPAAAALSRIEAAGARVLRTDLDGDIRFVSREGRVTLQKVR